MASYIVLSPPGGDVQDEKNRFIKDGFSLWAALFPFVWALSKRLYVEALVLLALQSGVFFMTRDPRFELPASAFSLFLGLLWGFEARNWLANRLEKAGWQQQAIIVASSLGDAEAMFYGGAATVRPRKTAHALGRSQKPTPSTEGAFALGLMDYDKGRP